jgi:hypothetical protein
VRSLVIVVDYDDVCFFVSPKTFVFSDLFRGGGKEERRITKPNKIAWLRLL